jgi:hypothetical protein
LIDDLLKDGKKPESYKFEDGDSLSVLEAEEITALEALREVSRDVVISEVSITTQGLDDEQATKILTVYQAAARTLTANLEKKGLKKKP